VDLSHVETLPELLKNAASVFGPEAAVQWAGGALTAWSYQEVHDRAMQGAAYLADLGLKPGSPVVLMIESGPDWVAAFFAVQAAGGVAVPLPEWTAPEMVAAVERRLNGCRVIVGNRTPADFSEFPAIEPIPVENLFKGSDRLNCPVPRAASEPALLAFTSGTTQQPKVVVLSHSNLLADVRSVTAIRSGGPGDVMLSLLPLSHLFGLTAGLLVPLSVGARIVYVRSPLPNRIFESIRNDGVTHALAVPALVEGLFQEAWFESAGSAGSKDRRDWHVLEAMLCETGGRERLQASLRGVVGDTFETLIVGAAALRLGVAEILDLLGICTISGYGLTEAGPIVSLGVVGDCPPGSVGRPLPGVDVRLGQNDEIQVRGPNVMIGYLDDPDLTASVLTDGWLRTGDRGRIEPDGSLRIIGRLKEAIVSASGETVNPEEMELSYRHDLFSEVCVAGIPDEAGNDVPVLFVVPVDLETTSEAVEPVFWRLRAKAPSRLRPERVVLWREALPRTALGKVRRGELIRRLVGGTKGNEFQ